MRQFDLINPDAVASDPRTVAKCKEKGLDCTWYLLIDGTHVIIAAAECHIHPKTQQQSWIYGQIALPKQGLVWFCDTIKNKFFKTEAEGGLPREQFGTTAEIDGEKLKAFRAANADGKGNPGYTLTTLDRLNKTDAFPEAYSFPDTVLFEGGLMDVFRRVANEIQAGNL